MRKWWKYAVLYVVIVGLVVVIVPTSPQQHRTVRNKTVDLASAGKRNQTVTIDSYAVVLPDPSPGPVPGIPLAKPPANGGAVALQEPGAATTGTPPPNAVTPTQAKAAIALGYLKPYNHQVIHESSTQTIGCTNCGWYIPGNAFNGWVEVFVNVYVSWCSEWWICGYSADAMDVWAVKYNAWPFNFVQNTWFTRQWSPTPDMTLSAVPGHAGHWSNYFCPWGQVCVWDGQDSFDTCWDGCTLAYLSFWMRLTFWATGLVATSGNGHCNALSPFFC